MIGRGGLFRQENVEKRKVMSVREWAEACNKDEFRSPGIDDVGLHARGARIENRSSNKRRTRAESSKLEAAEADDCGTQDEPVSPPPSIGNPQTPDGPPFPPVSDPTADEQDIDVDEVATPQTVSDPQEKQKPKGKRVSQTREAREASLAERASKDRAFIDVFDPRKDWLPSNTTNNDYTVDFCQKLERQYWRNCGLGKPAWYGADMQGSYIDSRPDISFTISQARCTPTRPQYGTSLTFLPSSLVSYPLPQRVFPVSTPRIFTLECGGRPLHGMSKTWTFSVSISSTLAHQNFGMQFLKPALPPWSLR